MGGEVTRAECLRLRFGGLRLRFGGLLVANCRLVVIMVVNLGHNSVPSKRGSGIL